MNGANYLLAVDYFSRYFETIKLKSTSSASIIEEFKSFTSRHGIPVTIISGQWTTVCLPRVCYICVIVQLPTYHKQPTISTEHWTGRMYVSFKQPRGLLKNVEYPYMALLTYHTTPLTWCNLSAAQLLMDRCLRNHFASGG